MDKLVFRFNFQTIHLTLEPQEFPNFSFHLYSICTFYIIIENFYIVIEIIT